MTHLSAVGRACVLALLALVCLPTVVVGHAELVESSPPDGGTLSDPPYTLVAEFSEEVGTDRSRIVVRDAAGSEVARGGVSDEDAHLMIVDLTGLPPGDYSARWTAVTPSDNGVTRGTIQFTVAQPASPTPAPSPTTTTSGTPTATRTPGETPVATPRPSPTATPEPNPLDPDPTGGTGDLLIALALAGVLVAGVAVLLWRRRGT